MTVPGEAVAGPRLVVICNSFPVLSETFIVDHVTGMLASGWNVTVVARKVDWEGAVKVHAGEKLRFDLIELPDSRRASRWRRWWTVWRALQLMARKLPSHVLNRVAWSCARQAIALSHVIESRTPSIVHAHFGPNGVTSALASDLPLLVDFHGYDLTSWPQRWGWRLYRQSLGDAVIIVHSPFAERRLIESGIANVKRVTMGVDMDRFLPAKREQSWPNRLRLASVGRLIPQKGHDVALRAVAILRNTRPDLDVHLRIVGAGPERGALESLADRLGIRDRLEGPTAVHSGDMPAVYRSADILVAASQSTADGWEEAFCRTAVEGMACGLPVVATPCGGLPDTIGTGGSIAAGQDPDSLAVSIAQLIAAGSPAHWAALAVESAGRFKIERMHQEYSACSEAALWRDTGLAPAARALK